MTSTTIPQPQTHITAGGIRIVYDPRPAGALVQIVIDGQRHGRFYASHTHALDVYRELVKQHTADLEVGEQTVDTVGRITVTVARTTPGVWAVTTYQASYRAEAWCWSYDSQAQADSARSHTLATFTAHDTVDAVELARDATLAEYNRYALRLDRPSKARTVAAARTLAGLATLAERAQLADIAEDIARLNNAA